MTTQDSIQITTQGRGIYDITQQVSSIVSQTQIQTGLCHVFCQHTSASLILCENYDNDVKVDTETFLSDLIPDGDARFTHVIEGKDDMPAHLRTLLTHCDLSIPIIKGTLGLGQWQGICLYEHRYQGHQRSVIVSLLD